MIQRLYIDRFKTFQNFAWKPGPVALLMGRNRPGAGLGDQRAIERHPAILT